MERRIISQMPSVTVHIAPEDKEVVQRIADSERLGLSTYCRKIIAEYVREVLRKEKEAG